MSKKGAQDSKTECGDCYYDYVSISYGSVEENYCGSIISAENTMALSVIHFSSSLDSRQPGKLSVN